MASCHTQAPLKRNQRGYGRMLYPPKEAISVGMARWPYPPKEAICVGMARCHTLLKKQSAWVWQDAIPSYN